MSDTLLFVFAVAVFSLMVIGVVLTILEFSRGEPARQEKENQQEASKHGPGR